MTDWFERGQEAAHNDRWMVPCYQEEIEERLVGGGSLDLDVDEILLAHRQAWEETDHFQLMYGRFMRDEAIDKLVSSLPPWNPPQPFILEMVQQLEHERFWDGWEDEVGARDLIEKALWRRRGE